MPGVVTVAMIGALSVYVNARTYRLPNTYTVVIGIGIVLSVIIGGVISPLWQERLLGAPIGAPIQFVPITLLNRLPGGTGGGDVKLALALGTLVSPVGLHAASLALALSFVSAGVVALWRIAVGSAGAKTHVPIDPWMIGAVLIGTITWDVIPDWLWGSVQVLSWTAPE